MRVESHKIAKTGQPIDLHLIETDDVVATLGAKKGRRWVVGFALETEDHRLRALAKLEQKFCDLMVSNGPQAISAHRQRSRSHHARRRSASPRSPAPKETVAAGILAIIEERLIALWSCDSSDRRSPAVPVSRIPHPVSSTFMSTFAVILPAAGQSRRFHDKAYKKPFAPLGGRAVWLHSAERFMNRADVKQVIVVIAAEDRELFNMKFGANIAILGVRSSKAASSGPIRCSRHWSA